MSDEHGKVLYELTPILSQVTQIHKDPLRPLKLKSFPERLSNYVEGRCPWRVAVHEPSKLVSLLLHNGDVEVWDINTNNLELVGRNKVPLDGHIEWTSLEWSHSGTLLLLAHSTPYIHVMDVAANPCYSIPLTKDPQRFELTLDPLHCVAQISMFNASDTTKWCDRVVVLQYSTVISCFDIGRLSGFHPIFVVHLDTCIDRGLTTSFAFFPATNLLLVACLYKPSPIKGDSTALQFGIRMLRRIDGPPHFIAVPLSRNDQMLEDAQKDSIIVKFLDYVPFCTTKRDCLVQMFVSPCNTKLVSLSTNGDMLVWQLPSMHLLHTYTGSPNPSHPRILGVGWWSTSELIVHRNDGAVYIVLDDHNLESALRPQAQASHLFMPWSQFRDCTQGLSYVQETNICDEQQEEDDGKMLLAMKMGLIAAYGWTKLLLGWAVGQPLHEVNRPSPESIAMRRIDIKLNELRGFTPEQMFKKKLLGEEYGEALKLARAYKLDTDVVYRQQWNHAKITKHTIRDYLSKVVDRNWVLKQCLSRVASTDEDTARLIELGISLTQISDDHMQNHANWTQEQRQTCRNRIKLMHHKIVLDDYQAIQRKTGASFDSQIYDELKSLSFLDLALHFAQIGECTSVLVILARHKAVLYPHWYPILSNIPEVVPINDYAQLMPSITNGSVKCWESEKVSVTSHDKYAEILGEMHDWNDATLIYEHQPELTQFRLLPESDVHNVTMSWLTWRALQLETLSAIPTLTHQFLAQALSMGFSDLKNLERDSKVYVDYVKDTEDLTSSLTTFQNATPGDVITRIVDNHLEGDLLRTVTTKVLPYVLHCESQGRCDAKATLFSFVKSQSIHSLRLVSKIVSACHKNNFEQGENGLLLNVDDTFSLVEGCIIECNCVGDELIIPATQLINYLPQEGVAEYIIQRIDKLHNFLKALSMLDLYGVKCTMLEIRKCSEDKQASEALLIQCMTKTTSKKNIHKEYKMSDWERLNNDLLTVRESALPLVSVDKCATIFVRGLLSSRDSNIIQCAKIFCTTSNEQTSRGLCYSVTVDLVLSASREYIQGAENANDQLIQLANNSLQIIQHPIPPKVKEDIEMLAALPVLEELGLNELPVRIYIATDRLEFVERALKCKPGNYKEAKTLLKLCDFLCVDKSLACESLRHGRILYLCAKQAIECGDYIHATKYCRMLVSLDYNNAWDVCMDIVNNSSSMDVNTAIHLISFALLHCDSNELPKFMQIMKSWKIKALQLQLASNDGIDDVLTTSKDVMKMGLATVLNIIQITNKPTSNKRILTQQIDAMYLSLDSVQNVQMLDDLEENVLNEDMLILANQIRLLCVRLGNGDERLKSGDESYEQCIATLINQILPLSLSWAMSLMLNMENCTHILETSIQPYENNEFLAQLMIYFYSLLLLGNVQPLERDRILEMQPKDVIYVTCKYIHVIGDSQCKSRFMYWTDVFSQINNRGLLAHVSKDVDIGRFTKEKEYRTDTIIGMALNLNEEVFQSAVDLAKKHEIDEFDVFFAHLEFILTDSGLPLTEMQAVIKSRKLVTSLAKQPHKLIQQAHKTILPQLETNNGSLLLLYWLLIEKACGQIAEASHAQTHRAIIRHLMKLTPRLDYRKILDEHTNLYTILFDHLNSANHTNIAKVLAKIPTRKITQSEVHCVWAAKVFHNKLLESNVTSACKYAFDCVVGSSANDVISLVDYIMDNEYKYVLKEEDKITFYEKVLQFLKTLSISDFECEIVQQKLDDLNAAKENKYKQNEKLDGEPNPVENSVPDIIPELEIHGSKPEREIPESQKLPNLESKENSCGEKVADIRNSAEQIVPEIGKSPVDEIPEIRESNPSEVPETSIEIGERGSFILSQLEIHPLLRNYSAAMFLVRKQKEE